MKKQVAHFRTLLILVWVGCSVSSPIQTTEESRAANLQPNERSTAATINAPVTVTPLGPGGGGAFDVLAFSPDYVYVGTDIGGLYRSADHGLSWQTANSGLYDYMINDIAVDPAKPSILYLATPGGVYKSIDTGNTWQLMLQGFPEKESKRYSAEISTIAIDWAKPEIVYAGTGHVRQGETASGNGDIYKSLDGGVSWSKYNLGDSTAASYKIVVDPLDNRYVYAATGVGFFRSLDGGSTWEQIDRLDSRGLAIGTDTGRSKVVLYRTAWSSGVYKTEDRGKTWKKLNILACLVGCHFYRIVLDPSGADAQTVYVGDYGDWNQDRGILFTKDGGKSWQQINTIDDSGWAPSNIIHRVRSLGINPYDPKELYYGHSMGLFKRIADSDWNQVFAFRMSSAGGVSTDWSGTWVGRNDINNTQVNTEPMFHPRNRNEYYLGIADLYIWKTSDNGISWQNIKLPGDNDVRVLRADPDDVDFRTWYAATSSQQCCHGGLYKTTDAGRKWKKASGLPDDRIWDIAITSGIKQYIYATTYRHGVYWSTDGGVSFQPRNGGPGDELPNGSIYHIALDAANPNVLFISVDGSDGGIFGTTDGGEIWQEAGDLSDCQAVAILSLDPNELFAGCRVQLYKSKDGGRSWSLLFNSQEHPLYPASEWSGAYIRDIALHPTSSQILCFVIKDDPFHDQSAGGGLYCSQDGGSTWRELAKDLGLLLRGVSVAFHPLPDPQTGAYDLFYMTGGNGAYKIAGKFLIELLQTQGGSSAWTK